MIFKCHQQLVFKGFQWFSTVSMVGDPYNVYQTALAEYVTTTGALPKGPPPVGGGGMKEILSFKVF